MSREAVASPPSEGKLRLFEPFVTTKEVGKGTGLGLAVCRGLVESAQGTIRVDDSFRQGARFIVDLPIAKDIESEGHVGG